MGKSNSVEIVNKSVELYINDREKRMKEMRRLIRKGQKSGDIRLVGAAYYHLAIDYDEADDRNGTITNAVKAAALLKDTDEYELTAKAYVAAGYAYSLLGNFQLEFDNYKTAYNIIKKHRIKGRAIIMALNNLSTSYHILGDCKTAIRMLTECIDLIKTNYPEDYSDIAMYSLNLSECYKDNGELDKTEEILLSIADWIDKIDSPSIYCDFFLRSAIISYVLGKREKGDEYLDIALEHLPQGVYPLPLYDDLGKISHHLNLNGDRERAQRILDLMTAFVEKNTGEFELMFAYRAIADHYKYFGDNKRAAEVYATLCELFDKRMDDLKTSQLKMHKMMADSDAELGRLKRKMRQNEALYSLEPMTKLLNRSALLTVSSEFISAAARKKQNIGAIFIDIDYFKECNDTYGHAKGDEIIKGVARVCKEEEAANVRFARYGGDEFFGITRGLTDDEVVEIAKRICSRIRDERIPNKSNPNGNIITLSAGVVNVAINSRTDTIIEIANYADKAVYYAKRAGKNAIYLLRHSDHDQSTDYVKIDF